MIGNADAHGVRSNATTAANATRIFMAPHRMRRTTEHLARFADAVARHVDKPKETIARRVAL
jgi:hypothetical protein